MQIGVNWTTGDLNWFLFRVFIPSGTYSQAPFSPIFICVSIPLGGILFLLKRKHLAVETDKQGLDAVNLAQ
jgi:hypothetical protein